MTAFLAACGWVIAAALASALPSRRNHWPLAGGLIAAGLPVLVWVWASNPWGLALAVTLAMASVLRWPIRYALRWLAGQGHG